MYLRVVVLALAAAFLAVECVSPQEPVGTTLTPTLTPSAESTPAPTAINLNAPLTEADVKRLAQEAFERSGTYRWQTFLTDKTRRLVEKGAVNLRQGVELQRPDGAPFRYDMGTKTYQRQRDTWEVTEMGVPQLDNLALLIRSLQGQLDSEMWKLQESTETVDGKPSYVIQKNLISGDDRGPYHRDFTIWLEKETFLPIKSMEKLTYVIQWSADWNRETIYSDFGAPIDVKPPPAALLAEYQSSP